MGSSNFLLSLLGWTFIPDFATRQLLNYIYKSPVKIFAPTQPGSLQHRKHYALTFAFVIFSYLCYTLYQSASSMPPSFYEILGVAPTVDENGLKLAFRAFAKRYHPDRPGVGPAGADAFMYVRDAYEALKDPVVRFAYDRFGPDVIGWKHCKTTREFMHQGIMASSGYHIVTGIALLFYSAIGQKNSISFWRYVLFGALFAAELSFIVSPFPTSPSNIFTTVTSTSTNVLGTVGILPTSSILQTLFPNRAPYQHILFLHQCFMVLTVALSRVVPQFVFLFSDGNADAKKLDPVEKEIWERVYSTLAIADREASIILHTLLQSVSGKPNAASHPYHTPTLARPEPLDEAKANEVLDELTPEMWNLVVEANIKNQTVGPLATAWDAALRKAAPAKVNGGTQTTPTPRARAFWEKAVDDAADTESSIVFIDALSASATGVPSGRSSPVKGGDK